MKSLEPQYPSKRALILPALHAAQEEFGWLPKEAMNEIAEYIGVHFAQIREVASFYTMFNLEPVGKTHIKLCTNVACYLRGAEEVMEYAEKKLGIHQGETTHDGCITLSEEECLGACTCAPVMMVNDRYVENVGIQKMNEVLEASKCLK